MLNSLREYNTCERLLPKANAGSHPVAIGKQPEGAPDGSCDRPQSAPGKSHSGSPATQRQTGTAVVGLRCNPPLLEPVIPKGCQ
jgi:hypothetical protein